MTPPNVHPSALPARVNRGGGRLARPHVPFAGLERLLRFGLMTRGIIYFLPGVFALQWALGRDRRPMTEASVIDTIGQQRLGHTLLIVVAIGLAAYAAWGLVRAVSDPVGHGRSPRGIALRVGYVTSSIGYVGLLVVTIRLLSGGPALTAQPQEWSVGVLARPFGGVLVAAIGLSGLFGSGIAQIVTGVRHSFVQDLELERMGRRERRWAIGLGSVALVSRGIVYSIVGIMVIAAGLHGPSQYGTGLEGALSELAQQPFGRGLVALAGLGLMTFGAYSILTARWMRMRRIVRAVAALAADPVHHPAPRP